MLQSGPLSQGHEQAEQEHHPLKPNQKSPLTDGRCRKEEVDDAPLEEMSLMKFAASSGGPRTVIWRAPSLQASSMSLASSDRRLIQVLGWRRVPWIPGDGALSSSSRWSNQMAKRSPKSPNGQETQGSAEDETNDEDEAKDRQ